MHMLLGCLPRAQRPAHSRSCCASRQAVLVAGLDDGAGLSSEDEGLIVRIVAGGFTDIDGATDMAEKAAHTRAERIKAYK